MGRGQWVNVNDKRYKIVCIFNEPRKCPNRDSFGVQLEVRVYSENESKYILWEEIKGTYLAEKLSDFAENSFNGQNAFYWNNDKNKLRTDKETELRILNNFINSMNKAYRMRTMNGVVVRDILMSGTSTMGSTSCINKCVELGIDPYGYEFMEGDNNE